VNAASPHLAQLGARGRPTGGASAAEARAYCAAVLVRLGFRVLEDSFEYSSFAGAWAAPAAGLLLVSCAIGFFAGRRVPALGLASVAVLVIGLALLAWLGRRGVLDFALMRRRGVNLEATRGPLDPSVWLVAHLDSKWQPVSMIQRVLSVVATSVGTVVMLAVCFAPVHFSDRVASVSLIVTLVAAIPLLLSVVSDRNHGTLDNASGAAAVLHAAELLPPEARVGVLITDAEELALAGARAWARGRAAGVALNCDSIDDDGQLTVMYTRGKPQRLVDGVMRAAAQAGEPVRVLRLLPGVLTDSVALADAGWETLTLSRGSARTLRRIHTSRDSLAWMSGSGISGAARVLAATALELS